MLIQLKQNHHRPIDSIHIKFKKNTHAHTDDLDILNNVNHLQHHSRAKSPPHLAPPPPSPAAHTSSTMRRQSPTSPERQKHIMLITDVMGRS